MSDRGLSHLVLARRGYGAITFGHVIVSSAPLTEHGWRHELAHVAQYDRLGLAFVPLYLWHYARVGYARHPFEREAEAVARARVSVRLATDDDVSALRRLVNAAYAELEALGLNFTGTYQDEEITRRRGRGAEVYLLFADDRLVGTVSVRIRGEARPPHAYVNQLAVDPAFRHRGIGSELTAFAELVARERGVRRVRLDTAIPARHLLRFYERRGYRVIGETRWEGKTYRSAILEKMLGDDRQ